MKTIVIDPGHGGYDLGATAFGREEKTDNLQLAQLVAQKLRDAGQNVIMTRNSDIFIPLTTRADISNKAGADLFISLHRNAYSSPSATGVENFVNINAPKRTKQYAEIVLDYLANAGVTVNRGVKEADFSVLRNTTSPAQLLEVGFLTNPIDNVLFDKNIDDYATAIADGILLALGETSLNGGNEGNGGTEGNSGENISRADAKAIQNFLNSAYASGLSVDGIVGAKTKKALTAALQTELNRLYNARLAVDGLFGAKTKAAAPNVQKGARGNLVKLLQSALTIKGYPVALDGIFGAATENAVRNFQSSNNLSTDGIIGKNTFEKLFNS